MMDSIRLRQLCLRVILILPILTLWLASTVSPPPSDEPPRPFSGPTGDYPPGAARGSLSDHKLPLYFIEDRGQLDGRISYYVQGRDTSFYFDPGGITISTTRVEDGAGYMLRPVAYGRRAEPRMKRQRAALKVDFVGAGAGVKPRGKDRASTVINYFKGPRSRWKMGLASYGALVYENLWPGIDLVYDGSANGLKYTFTVRPGADPGLIKLRCRGASSMSVSPTGQLEAETPAGVIRDDRPYSYQDENGRRVEVATRYDLKREAGEYVYGFSVGDYDRQKVLTIDPVVLLYCGYVGGAGFDQGSFGGITIDAEGNAYVFGDTDSDESTFPVTVGPDLTFNEAFGGLDAFVAKVNPQGTDLVYCGYIGGAGSDFAGSIAVDHAGSAYVLGETDSDESTFPVSAGPDLSYNGNVDAYVAKVSAAGTGLNYCGYVGGAEFDSAFEGGIAVDGEGSAYMVGGTQSTESPFPASVGPDLTHNGAEDAFVAKVNAAGTGLVYCGYIGGAGGECSGGIAVDATGSAYVLGETDSNEATFPVRLGPDLRHNGDTDAFVAKIAFDQPFLLRLKTPLVRIRRGRDREVRIIIERDEASSGRVTVAPPDASAIGVKVKPSSRASRAGRRVEFTVKVMRDAPAGTRQLVFTGRDEAGGESAAVLTLVIR
jgi:hypothetical protein